MFLTKIIFSSSYPEPGLTYLKRNYAHSRVIHGKCKKRAKSSINFRPILTWVKTTRHDIVGSDKAKKHTRVNPSSCITYSGQNHTWVVTAIKHTKICLKRSKQNQKRIIIVVYYLNIKEMRKKPGKR